MEENENIENNETVETIDKAEKESQVYKNEDPEMVKMKEELENTTDRLKRIAAEFDNYKKRNAKERDLLYRSILGDIVNGFLPVIDNMEKAASAETTDENYKQGIDLVLKQFLEVLSSFGVKPIESVGKEFDPELHEAVSMVQDETLGEKIIKEEYRKGYKLGDKVIRHAMVVVAN